MSDSDVPERATDGSPSLTMKAYRSRTRICRPFRSSIMSAHVLAFPAAQRRSHVRNAVKMLNETHGEAANEAWKILVRKIADELGAIGLSTGEMRQQVMEFQAAVQLELCAQSAPEGLCPRCS